MESLSQSLHQPLELLIYTSVVLIIIIGVFLIKLLIDLSGLINSMQDFIKATQAELEPAIREIKATLVNINQISSNVSNRINNMNEGIKKGLQTVLEVSTIVGKQALVVGEALGKKLMSGLYLLMSLKK